MQNNWVPITQVANIPLREGRKVVIGDLDIALFNLGDRFVAVENRCPHGEGPLADGIVSHVSGKLTVTCPLHSWKICLETGGVAKPAGQAPCVRSFAAKVEQGIVSLQLPQA